MATQLAPPRLASDPALPAFADYAAWADYAPVVGGMVRRSMWLLGDWLRVGEARWGEMYTQAVNDTGLDAGTLRNAKYVAGRIEPSRRRDELSFSHHQEVAPLPPARQDALLSEAAAEQLPVKSFRARVSAERHASAPIDAAWRARVAAQLSALVAAVASAPDPRDPLQRLVVAGEQALATLRQHQREETR